MTRRDVVVLGSTGSIGTQALDVCRANPDRFRVVALTAADDALLGVVPTPESVAESLRTQGQDKPALIAEWISQFFI